MGYWLIDFKDGDYKVIEGGPPSTDSSAFFRFVTRSGEALVAVDMVKAIVSITQEEYELLIGESEPEEEDEEDQDSLTPPGFPGIPGYNPK